MCFCVWKIVLLWDECYNLFFFFGYLRYVSSIAMILVWAEFLHFLSLVASCLVRVLDFGWGFLIEFWDLFRNWFLTARGLI